MREYAKRYRERNRAELNRRAREKAKINKEKHRIRNLEYRKNNREKVRVRGRKHYAANREKLIAQSLSYQNRDKVGHLKRRRELRLRKRDENNKRQKEWRRGNRDKLRIYAKRKWNKKMATSLSFAIRERLRTRIRQAIRSQSGNKATKTMDLLGCSLSDFRIYTESKFDVGMNWDNWGWGKDKWNLDHIVPCAIFDLTKPEHQKRCFHFSNYQPLWQPDNFKKNAKTTGQFNLL